jgi:pimeloyl-ACP methyl ester carboxylesterase
MSKLKYILLLGALLLPLALQNPIAMARNTPELPLELEGELHGAAYRIVVPENWNGTLLLYARGYSPNPVTSPDVAILGAPTEALLLEHGYALAASGFRNAGWNVEEGIWDTQQLLIFFRRNVAYPERVLIYGGSMGGAVVLNSMEMFHGLYDGAVPICAAPDGTLNADLKLDFTVAYAAAFGWASSWGDIGDLPDGEEGFQVYQQVMANFWGNFAQLSDPAVFARFEFMRLVNDMPLGAFYQPQGAQFGPGVALNMMLGYYIRYELEARAGGPAAQNANHVYSLSDADRARLMGLGMTDAEMDDLLATMNGMANIEARRSARQYLKRFDPSGRIISPVLMLHNIEDPLAIVQSTQVYYEKVASQGREDLLMRAYTDRPGHCNVTPVQVLAMFEAMESWLDTGTTPGAEAFPTDLGFVLDFEPEPWPQPPQE